MSPSREFDARPLDEPPYYVIEAAPAITFTFGGLLIDRHARVLARGGVVPGLLAAGSDAGGLYHCAYAGGLAPALVFGLAAARTALAREARSDGAWPSRVNPDARRVARPASPSAMDNRR